MTPLPLADKRVSWIALAVLLLCFVLVVASRGASESFAVFLLPLGVEFGWGRSELTSIYTALMISFAIASPLAGIIFDRFGARVVYGLGILMLALGYGLCPSHVPDPAPPAVRSNANNSGQKFPRFGHFLS